MLFNVIAIYLFLTIIVSVFLASYVQSRSKSNYSRAMFYLSMVVCIYLFGYLIELNATTESQVMFWNRFQYLGIPFVSALWLTVALMYTNRLTPNKRTWVLFVYPIPIVTFILRVTNSLHHLYFSSTSIISSGDRLLLRKEIGIWMYVQLIHSMSMIIISLVIFVFSFIKSSKTDKNKLGLMLIASSFAILGLILNVIQPGDYNLDFMVLCLPITAIMVIIAIIRYDFLEVKTLARNMIFQNSHDAMILLNHESKVVDFNTEAKRILNLIGVNIQEDSLYNILDDQPNVLHALTKNETVTYIHETNTIKYYYEITTDLISSGKNSPYGLLKTITDITKTHQLNEMLIKQASTDVLSGLSNRRAFMEAGQSYLDESMESKTSLHMFMMDLDHFKGINDKYGHQAGDEIIQQFSKILQTHFREKDIVARLGGEEFGVLVKGLSDQAAYQKAESLRLTVSANRRLDDKILLTVSIGIASLTHDINNLDQLLKRADQAMYTAKQKGRNRTKAYEVI